MLYFLCLMCITEFYYLNYFIHNKFIQIVIQIIQIFCWHNRNCNNRQGPIYAITEVLFLLQIYHYISHSHETRGKVLTFKPVHRFSMMYIIYYEIKTKP